MKVDVAICAKVARMILSFNILNFGNRNDDESYH